MSMFRNYLLKNDFWAKKGNGRTVYMKHDIGIGGLYAYLENRGVRLVIRGKSYFFDNFDQLDFFLNRLNATSHDDNFSRIIRRRNTENVLRTIAI